MKLDNCLVQLATLQGVTDQLDVGDLCRLRASNAMRTAIDQHLQIRATCVGLGKLLTAGAARRALVDQEFKDRKDHGHVVHFLGGWEQAYSGIDLAGRKVMTLDRCLSQLSGIQGITDRLGIESLCRLRRVSKGTQAAVDWHLVVRAAGAGLGKLDAQEARPGLIEKHFQDRNSPVVNAKVLQLGGWKRFCSGIDVVIGKPMWPKSAVRGRTAYVESVACVHIQGNRVVPLEELGACTEDSTLRRLLMDGERARDVQLGAVVLGEALGKLGEELGYHLEMVLNNMAKELYELSKGLSVVCLTGLVGRPIVGWVRAALSCNQARDEDDRKDEQQSMQDFHDRQVALLHVDSLAKHSRRLLKEAIRLTPLR